ncbi:MAG TPA: GAF domain-containing protein, partial [Longimicrobiales bacterium]|nr:GAF domain-containing protein [Longimicrobiales bacterium]
MHSSVKDRAEEILAAVVFGAQNFMKEEDWTRNVDNWLERLGEATGTSQVRIFSNDPVTPGDTLRASACAEWIADGAFGSPLADLQHISYREAGCVRWEEALPRGESIVGITEEMPESERAILESQGDVAVAIVPVFAGERWWGFIGFADCFDKRVWREAELNALAAAAGIYGAAIARKEMEDRIGVAVIHEQMATEIGAIVTRSGNTLDEILELCCARIAYHLHADAVRVWTASDINIGEGVVGRVAESHTHEVFNEGAAYPLIFDDELVGVVLLTQKERPSAETLEGIASITDELALAIARYRATSALHMSQDRYRHLVNATLEGICIHDGVRIHDGNPGIAAMVGYSVEEIIGMSPLAFIHPDSVDEARRNIAAKYPGPYEVKMLRRDGSVFVAELRGSHFEYDGQDLRVTTVRDMTERKASERTAQELVEERLGRESANKARLQAEFMADASRVLSSSFDTTTTLNQLAHLCIPYLADFCVVSIFHDDGIEHVAMVHVDQLNHEVLAEAVTQWKERWRDDAITAQQVSGTPFIASMLPAFDVLGTESIMSVPIFSGGKLIGSIVFSAGPARRRFETEDLALAQELARRTGTALESARSYHEAQAATAARDDMLAVVAHDLRNPLNTIYMGSSFALEAMAEHPEIAQRQFEIIVRTSEHMNRLIQDLLDATRLQSGQLALERVATNPCAVVS